jgi:hypothetical protein
MSGFIGGMAAAIVFGLVAIKVFQFFNVTVWQCRKFGNCPGWWPERLR